MKKQLTGEGGKGSSQRATDSKKFASNWDKIFGKKEAKDEQDERSRARTTNK